MYLYIFTLIFSGVLYHVSSYKGNIEKGNINKLKFDEIIKYNYPMSSAHAKTAMEIIKLYFQNSYKEYYEEYKEAENTILSIMDKMLPNFKSEINKDNISLPYNYEKFMPRTPLFNPFVSKLSKACILYNMSIINLKIKNNEIDENTYSTHSNIIANLFKFIDSESEKILQSEIFHLYKIINTDFNQFKISLEKFINSNEWNELKSYIQNTNPMFDEIEEDYEPIVGSYSFDATSRNKIDGRSTKEEKIYDVYNDLLKNMDDINELQKMTTLNTSCNRVMEMLTDQSQLNWFKILLNTTSRTSNDENNSNVIYCDVNVINDILVKGIVEIVKKTPEMSNYTVFDDFNPIETKQVMIINKTYKITAHYPKLFCFIRKLYDIDNINIYLNSFNSKLISNQIANESTFYHTQDNKLMIKSIDSEESLIFERILYSYFIYLNEDNNTLLPKFFGIYILDKPSENISKSFLVLNNTFPTKLIIHKKYKLTNFQNKISVSDETNTNLPTSENEVIQVFLKKKTYHKIIKTIKRDFEFLRDCNITNYSILLGIHYLDNNNFIGQNYSNEKVNAIYSSNDSFRIGIKARNSAGKYLLLFIEIIDILKKHNEHNTEDHNQFLKFIKKEVLFIEKFDMYDSNYRRAINVSTLGYDKQYGLFNNNLLYFKSVTAKGLLIKHFKNVLCLYSDLITLIQSVKEISETKLSLEKVINLAFQEFIDLITFAKMFSPYMELLNYFSERTVSNFLYNFTLNNLKFRSWCENLIQLNYKSYTYNNPYLEYLFIDAGEKYREAKKYKDLVNEGLILQDLDFDIEDSDIEETQDVPITQFVVEDEIQDVPINETQIVVEDDCIPIDWISIDFQTLEFKTPPESAITEQLKEEAFSFIDKMNRLKLRRLTSNHFVKQLITLKDSKENYILPTQEANYYTHNNILTRILSPTNDTTSTLNYNFKYDDKYKLLLRSKSI